MFDFIKIDLSRNILILILNVYYLLLIAKLTYVTSCHILETSRDRKKISRDTLHGKSFMKNLNFAKF